MIYGIMEGNKVTYELYCAPLQYYRRVLVAHFEICDYAYVIRSDYDIPRAPLLRLVALATKHAERKGYVKAFTYPENYIKPMF